MPLSAEVEDSPVNDESSRRRSSLKEEITAEITRKTSSLLFPAEDKVKLSSNAITFNTLLSIIGTTVLGIANQMQRGGWFLTPALLILGCFIISEMTRLVSLTIDTLQEKNPGREILAYADFADMAFGPMGRAVSSVTSTFALLGMICGGLILISTNMQYSFPLTFLSESEEVQRELWAVFMSGFTALYLAMDLAPLLRGTAAVGPIVCLACVTLAWGAGARAIYALSDFPVECRTGPEGQQYWNNGPDTSAGFFATLTTIAGIASYGFYCFAVVVTVPSLKGQMEKPEEIVQASIIGYTTCTAAFIIIMFLAYWGFGNLGPLSIINGMRSGRDEQNPHWWATEKPWENGVQTWDGQMFSIMVIINLILTDAIYVPCTALCIEGFCPHFFKESKMHRAGSRAMLTLFRMLVATRVRNFIVLTSLISSAFCVMNNILMPTAAFYYTGTAEKVGTSPPRKAMHGAMFVFGVYCALVGTYGSLVGILSEASGEDPPEVGTFPRANPYAATDACVLRAGGLQTADQASGPSSEETVPALEPSDEVTPVTELSVDV